MTALEELEDIVGCLENIEPFGIEPDYSSLGLEPADVLGFSNEEELEKALRLLTIDINQNDKMPSISFFKLQGSKKMSNN